MAEHVRTELVSDAITLAARARLLGQAAIGHADLGSQPEFNRSSPKITPACCVLVESGGMTPV
ncbi:hypothetical protein [Amycolatopsis taiwanensis]|uniref:hypothetical protein n=1 Tax=Amycolatopsis taiwanensis TaxID=342230 RepID=UPI0004B43E60|nr:hypothetical protein [Amycolatopsis taiwanensis]